MGMTELPLLGFPGSVFLTHYPGAAPANRTVGPSRPRPAHEQVAQLAADVIPVLRENP
jgi:hypothetical protein